MSGHLHSTGEQQLATNIRTRPASVPAKACCILAVPVERMSFSFCALAAARSVFSLSVIFRRSRWLRSFPWPIVVVRAGIAACSTDRAASPDLYSAPHDPEKTPKRLILRPVLSRRKGPKRSTTPNNKPALCHQSPRFVPFLVCLLRLWATQGGWNAGFGLSEHPQGCLGRFWGPAHCLPTWARGMS